VQCSADPNGPEVSLRAEGTVGGGGGRCGCLPLCPTLTRTPHRAFACARCLLVRRAPDVQVRGAWGGGSSRTAEPQARAHPWGQAGLGCACVCGGGGVQSIPSYAEVAGQVHGLWPHIPIHTGGRAETTGGVRGSAATYPKKFMIPLRSGCQMTGGTTPPCGLHKDQRPKDRWPPLHHGTAPLAGQARVRRFQQNQTGAHATGTNPNMGHKAPQGEPPKGSLGYGTCAQEAIGTKAQKENGLVSGL
jgi:hypothetical protein